MHLTESRDVAVTKRTGELPTGVETYEHLRRHLKVPPLGPGSVDPQGISWRRAPVPSVRVVSVDGGHCALWLEPAATLRALFPVPGRWCGRGRPRIG